MKKILWGFSIALLMFLSFEGGGYVMQESIVDDCKTIHSSNFGDGHIKCSFHE